MKKIDEILDEMNSKSLYKYSPPFIDSNPTFTETDYKIINKLFVTFQSIFPAFRQSWPTEHEFEKAKREWMKAFKQVGLEDLTKIKIGVAKFRTNASPFVPSPGQFIAMCKPTAEDYGLKSTEMAFQEASTQIYGNESKVYSHITVKHARDLTGYFLLTNQPRVVSFPIFERNYEESVKQFLEGKILSQLELRPDFNHDDKKQPEGIEEFKHLKSNKSAMEKIKEMLK